jgi:hypothetical protein
VHRNRRTNHGVKLPADAVLLEERGPWEIHYSVTERAVLVRTNDYHPGILKLTENDLRSFAEKAAK